VRFPGSSLQVLQYGIGNEGIGAVEIQLEHGVGRGWPVKERGPGGVILTGKGTQNARILMRTFIPFEEALATVLSAARPMSDESIPLEEALGRTLSGPVVANEDIPPFASSAMDGFAVRSADLLLGADRVLRISDHIAAGTASPRPLEPGCAAAIMTGAVVPPGADAIIPVERVAARIADGVRFDMVPEPGKHIRPAAEDILRGSEVFRGGERITPPILGMLATLGIDPVPVRRRPVVRVISTGDEIVTPNSQPGPGQIRNSNGPALCAQVREAGGECPGYDHALDTPDAIRACIEAGADADILVFSGGVSMGEHDHVRTVLEDMGGHLHFWQVRQRPGKPLAFGELGRQLVLGLPGNPVSSAMCFEIYVRPLIERMVGCSPSSAVPLTACLERAMPKVENLHYFARGLAWLDAEGTLKVEDSGPQGSNLYSSVVRANCIIHLPAGTARVDAGSRVEIQILPWAQLFPVGPAG
jgi:molybdopterin molybdotransferase